MMNIIDNSVSSGLLRLKKQRESLEERIQAAEARIKTNYRKQETRRKILVGSYYLEKAKSEAEIEALKKLMQVFLTRNSDRKLFGLPELITNTKKKL